MTALSPMGRVPQRRPVPPRIKPRRRAGPWLAFLGVLVAVAVVVWWQVLGANGRTDSGDGCGPRVDQSVTAMDPKKVRVRVYNATDRTGLAKQVADGLKRRHFAVVASGNDPLRDARQVSGVGEIRYGTKGEKQALLLSFWFPGVQLVSDPRGDAAVDLAVGPTYKTLATDTQVAKAKKAAVEAAPDGGGC
jgi:hypothetical protein